MSHILMVETHGDPLGTVRHVLRTIWQNAKLDFMLAPTNDSGELKQTPYVLTSPNELADFNPFKPLMTSNTARFIPNLLQSQRNQKRIGAILRPCELRALRGLEKYSQVNTAGLLSISFDCLGTYPSEDYTWRTKRKGSVEQLTQETLQFAKQGGIVPYRFRAACQVCQSPAGESAQVNIGVIGLPIRQYILLSFPEKEAETLVTGNGLETREADPRLIEHHVMTIAKINERNHRVSERIRQGMSDIFPMSIEQLVDTFVECGDCQKCMQVCPLCAVHTPLRSESGKYLTEEIVRWAESCAGCGMCEQVCPHHKPLSAFFAFVRDQIYQETAALTAPTKSRLLQ
ncbi:MAG: Formate dehydrogenase [Anaerolineae bacterium]|nr:MAG: Formate dehydrogenase [Anaerolineae bacterium]